MVKKNKHPVQHEMEMLQIKLQDPSIEPTKLILFEIAQDLKIIKYGLEGELKIIKQQLEDIKAKNTKEGET